MPVQLSCSKKGLCAICRLDLGLPRVYNVTCALKRDENISQNFFSLSPSFSPSPSLFHYFSPSLAHFSLFHFVFPFTSFLFFLSRSFLSFIIFLSLFLPSLLVLLFLSIFFIALSIISLSLLLAFFRSFFYFFFIHYFVF